MACGQNSLRFTGEPGADLPEQTSRERRHQKRITGTKNKSVAHLCGKANIMTSLFTSIKTHLTFHAKVRCRVTEGRRATKRVHLIKSVIWAKLSNHASGKTKLRPETFIPNR